MKKFVLSIFCLVLISMPVFAENDIYGFHSQGNKEFNARTTAPFVIPTEAKKVTNSYQQQSEQTNNALNQVNNTVNQVNTIKNSAKSLMNGY